jgi:hypothetical protein
MSLDNIVYLCIFGGGFLLLGIMFIVGDADGEVDVVDDVDAEAAAGSPNAFSLKVISCFLVGFGAGALVSSYTIAVDEPLRTKLFYDLVSGLVGGILVGFVGWAVFKFFLDQQAHYEVHQSDYVGMQANLQVGIPADGIGEIFLAHSGKNHTVDVKSLNGDPIGTGTLVEVVSVSGHIGFVKPVE